VLLVACCCVSAVSAQWPGTKNAPHDLRPVSSGLRLRRAAGGKCGVRRHCRCGRHCRRHDLRQAVHWSILANARESAGHGVYVLWTYSADTTIGIRGADMRFNYYDRALQRWVYAESMDFMSRGVDAFRRPSDFGSIDVDTTGTSFISCVAGLEPLVARGTSGDYSDTTLPEFASLDAPIAVGWNGSVHVFLQAPTRNGLRAGSTPHHTR